MNLKLKWQSWSYNFAWSDYIQLFDGWIARCAIGVPALGYLIIFNDTIAEHLTFKTITSNDPNQFYFDTVTRLRFIYFGLIFLGLSNLVYRIRRPWVHRIGKELNEFTENALKTFTPTQYIRLHGIIRNEGPFTPSGKYYDSEWDRFLLLAVGVEGRSSKSDNRPGHWHEAKLKYETLLRGILNESFFRNSINRRISLSLCIFFSLIGYLFLLLPSFDLFIAVLRNTF